MCVYGEGFWLFHICMYTESSGWGEALNDAAASFLHGVNCFIYFICSHVTLTKLHIKHSWHKSICILHSWDLWAPPGDLGSCAVLLKPGSSWSAHSGYECVWLVAKIKGRHTIALYLHWVQDIRHPLHSCMRSSSCCASLSLPAGFPLTWDLLLPRAHLKSPFTSDPIKTAHSSECALMLSSCERHETTVLIKLSIWMTLRAWLSSSMAPCDKNAANQRRNVGEYWDSSSYRIFRGRFHCPVVEEKGLSVSDREENLL